MRTRSGIVAPIVAAAAMAAGGVAVAETNGFLPGGTSIGIDNSSPVDGDEFLIPLGDDALDIVDTGSARVGAVEGFKDTSVVYVIDRSGSTGDPAGIDCTGDGSVDTVLVCEQVGARAANSAAADPQSVVVNSAVVSYARNATVDLGLTTDFGAVATSINALASDDLTNYGAGVSKAQEALADPSAQQKRIVIFLSDGFSTTGTLTGAPSFGSNTIVRAFAIGSPSEVTCGGSSSFGTLDQVAALGAPGSACQQVTDPSTLADVIGEAIGSTLAAVEISVDGGAYTSIPSADLDAAVPQGPSLLNKVVNWSTVVADLGAGSHEICVRATGSDAGGTGTVGECKTIELLQLQQGPPEDVSAINELGEDDEHTIRVTVAGDTGGRDVTFVVTGVNPQTEVVQTDADGNASFTFSSPQDPSGLGTDTIEVSITVGDNTQTVTFTKEWVDTTPPTSACLESVNPRGRVPAAPGGGGQGQNQDGFYELSATDDIWPADSLEVYVIDDGSGTMFGPYSVGDVIKYTEDDEEVPVAKAIGGPDSEVRVHIIGNGDASVVAVDGSGNTSDPVACLVPEAPQ